MLILRNKNYSFQNKTVKLNRLHKMQADKNMARLAGIFDAPVTIDPDSGIIRADQIFKGILQCAPEEELTLRLPTAQELVNSSPIKIQQGQCKKFSIRNDGTAAITLTVGDGGTTNGSTTVPASSYAAHYVIRFINLHQVNPNYQLIRT